MRVTDIQVVSSVSVYRHRIRLNYSFIPNALRCRAVPRGAERHRTASQRTASGMNEPPLGYVNKMTSEGYCYTRHIGRRGAVDLKIPLERCNIWENTGKLSPAELTLIVSTQGDLWVCPLASQ